MSIHNNKFLRACIMSLSLSLSVIVAALAKHYGYQEWREFAFAFPGWIGVILLIWAEPK